MIYIFLYHIYDIYDSQSPEIWPIYNLKSPAISAPAGKGFWIQPKRRVVFGAQDWAHLC